MMENERIQNAQARINACKSLLDNSDYILIRIVERMISCETFEELLSVFKSAITESGKEISDRAQWRSSINDSEEEISAEYIDDFVVGKTYYKGDKVLFDGKIYECIAPDGVVCVWSPSDYPTYWKRLA